MGREIEEEASEPIDEKCWISAGRKGRGDRKGEGKGKSSGAYYGSQGKSGARGRDDATVPATQGMQNRDQDLYEIPPVAILTDSPPPPPPEQSPPLTKRSTYLVGASEVEALEQGRAQERETEEEETATLRPDRCRDGGHQHDCRRDGIEVMMT